jgi:hypothetical protein
MRIHQTTAPATLPLLIAEVREHLRLDDKSDDPKLVSLITAATAMIENYTDLFLVARTVEVFLDQWPQTKGPKHECFDHALAFNGFRGANVSLALPVRPVLSVEAVTVKDTLGSEVVLDPSVYALVPGLDPRLNKVSTASFPSPGVKTEGIRIALKVGFGESWNTVPADIHQALLLLITALYFQRGENGQSEAGFLHTSGASGPLLAYRKQRI